MPEYHTSKEGAQPQTGYTNGHTATFNRTTAANSHHATIEAIRAACRCDNPRCDCHRPSGNVHCPAHDDPGPSLSIAQGNGKTLVKCFAKCPQDKVIAALKARGVWSTSKINGHHAHEKKTIYSYTDENNDPLFEVLRTDEPNGKKKITQRRPDGRGGWHYNLKDTRRVLYNLPDVIRAGTVIVVEGEKCADAVAAALKAAGLYGDIVATTNPQGAGKWLRDYAQALAAKTVIVLPDNDDPGRNHAAQVLQSLHGTAEAVKLVQLPDLLEKGDVYDWLHKGRSIDELLQLIEAAPEWEPQITTPATPQFQPTLFIFNLTDLGNAERLVQRHGADLRYCYPWNKWVVWDGRRWTTDNTGEIKRRAKETVRSIYAEAASAEDDNKRRDIAKHAKASEATARITALIELAASSLPILPEDLDADPLLLNCENGTLNLRTAELQPHRRDHFITKLVPVEYDTSAICPRWNDFLHQITGGKVQLIGFLQRAIGYALTGDTREQALLILHGPGANGKSTLIETLMILLADYAQQTPTDTLLMKKAGAVNNDLADLRGARLVAAVEADEGRRLSEALVKQLTGGDQVTARRLYENSFTFRPQFKIFLATNHKPIIRGTDNAIWRRIRLVPFDVTIPPAQQDKTLPAKLRAELAGILAWAVRGCLEWQRDGLGLPEEVKAATEDYRAEMDVLADFLSECCTATPEAETKSQSLYEAYEKWCKQSGEQALSQKLFALRLNERGLEKRRKTRGVFWQGVGLLEISA